MRRNRIAVALALACALSGCGGHARRSSAPPQPRLPRALASQLALQSKLVADRLDHGDACDALGAAQALQQQALDAINRRQVPAPLQEPLMSAATNLATEIHCTPPAPHKGKEKHGKHDKGHH